MIRIDFSEFETTKEFHLWLKEQCHFPDYYGCNLDALYDCLSDNEYHFEIIIQEFNDYHKAIINTMKEAGCEVVLKG